MAPGHDGPGHAHGGRGPPKVLIFATLGFIGITVYVLIITHHLKIDLHGLHLQGHHRQTGSSSGGVVQLSKRAPIHPEAMTAFVARMLKLGAFSKYDVDGSTTLDQSEFTAFLTDLARSRILDPLALDNQHGIAADMVVGASNPAVTSENDPAVIPVVRQAGSKLAVSPGAEGGSSRGNAASSTVAAGGTGMCPELSRELVASFAVNNTIMLTVSDWRIFETFGVNWMKAINKLGVNYYLVGATDMQTSVFLGHTGRHPCFKFFEDGHGNASGNVYKYGGADYNAATWRKVVVVNQIVSWGFNVLHSDVDVVWFRDPLPYFLGPLNMHSDVVVSTDLVSTHNPKGDEGLEISIHQHVNMNTGVYFIKSTPGGKSFMKGWSDLRKTLFHDNDQVGAYRFVRGQAARVDYPRRILTFKAAPDPTEIRLGLLGVHMLLNGYTYFIPQLNLVQEVKALGVHLTWVPLSREGKFHRMRDGMLYSDPQEYYEGPMFITADIDHPVTPPDYNTEKDTEVMIKFHLGAMEQQLMQMYRVMAISTILNRTLVLPKMKCFCYKNWFMTEQCTIPGDKATVFPLTCQMDQWLRPKVMYSYGANIVGKDDSRQAFLFREHTLFENPNFPRQLLQQTVVVQPGDVTEPKVEAMLASVVGGSLKDVPGSLKVVTLPRRMKQDALKAALSAAVGQAKIVWLRKPLELFGGWDDPLLQKSFEAFLDKAAGNWCCREPKAIAAHKREKEKLAIHW